MPKPADFERTLAAIRGFLRADQIFLDMPMSEQTTFAIGGPADCMVCPASIGQVQQLLTVLQAAQMPYLILGNGSNVLVADAGIRGFVIKFNNAMASLEQKGETIIAHSGALLGDVARFAQQCSLGGLEFAVGIPGSIGGAVYMNAGAYGGEISETIAAVTAIGQDGASCRYTHEQLHFAYRHSIFQENRALICSVELQLHKRDAAAIQSEMDELTQKRESKQPLEMPSAGSTFKRPVGHFAGTLIDQTGLKGLSVGGAQVSLKHAGFIVNKGGATAADVLALIAEIQKRVYQKHGVQLFPEVRLIGDFT